MVDVMRAMLDELMGKERDVPLDRRTNKVIKFNDSSVCKHQLAGLCPNTLFRNTRSDLGSCGFEIHDDHIDWPKIKEDYDKLEEREKERYGYERDLLRYLEQLIRDMDKKIKINRERADKESMPKELRPEDRARLDDMQARIKESLDLSQRLGEEGDVDGSMMAAQQADAMKQQHEALQRSLTQPERTMTVCEICGVFINSTDNDQRKADHYNGKQYLGWKAIREKHTELTSKEGARLERGGSSREGERDRERERHSSRDRERERYSSRERERDYERERPRDRERDYRDRDREHRDRDRRDYDRDHRSGDYDRRGGDYRRSAEVRPPADLYRSRGGRSDYRRDY